MSVRQKNKEKSKIDIYRPPGYIGPLKTPSSTVLSKYGITGNEWWAIAARQNYACFVCQKVPTTGRLCVDHEHLPKWKKMPPERRKLSIRGALCFFCNKFYVGRAITITKARRVVAYLELYELRKQQEEVSTATTKDYRKDSSR